MSMFVNFISTWDDKGLKQANGSLTSSSKKFADWGKKIAKVAAVAAAAIAAAAIKIGIDAVKAASDFNETFSKSNVIFGDAAKAVQKFAETAASSLGQSKTQALDAASTFAVFGKSAGLAGQDLSNFAIDFTKLASDLASFNNTTPEEAITAIGAALRGESEPIRRYGVLLDDASMRQKAFELGIISSTKNALTPQQKVLAAQALIFEQTADAQGDFERTSSGLANSQRILAAEFENLKIEIGTALLPVITKLVSIFANDILPVIKQVADRVMQDLQPAFDAVVPIFEKVLGFFQNIGKDNKTPGWFAKLGEHFQWVKSTAESFLPILQDFWKRIQDNILPALMDLGKVFINDVLPAMRRFFDFIKPAVEFLARLFLDALAGAIEGAIQAIKGIMKVLSGLLDFIVGVFTGDWSRAWDGIKNIFTGAVDLLIGAVKFLWNAGILKAFNLGWQALKALVTKGWTALQGWFKGGISGIVNFFKELPGKLLNLATTWREKLIEIGKNLVQGIINGLKNSATAIVQAVLNLGGQIVDGIKDFFGISSPSKLMEQMGIWVMEGFEIGIKKGFDPKVVKEKLKEFKEAAKSELESAKELFVTFKNEVQSVIAGAIDFGAAFQSLEDSRAEAAENGESFGGTFIDELQKQADKATEFADKIKKLVEMGLSEDAIKEVLQAGVDAGTSIADELIAGGTNAINQTNALVDATKKAANKVAKFAADSYYGAGVETAKKLVDGFKDLIKEGGKGYKELMKEMDKLAKKLARDVKLTIKTSTGTTVSGASTVPEMAEGGIVSKPTLAILGERGSEMVTPLPPGRKKYGIDPVGHGGITINVTGALDPESVARQIETILKRSQLRAGAY